MSSNYNGTILSYGVIPIYINNEGNKEYLVVQNHGGFWGFPKGGANKNEMPAEAAARELLEETGIKVEADNLIENISYQYEMPTPDGPKSKTVYLFPATVDIQEVSLQQNELQNHQWVSLDKALQLINLETLKKNIKRMPNL